MEITLTLPDLPFDRNALSPIITEESFDYHYGKHHAAYVSNLQQLVRDSTWQEMSVAEIIKQSLREENTAIFNNAAQHWNHTFFWNCLSPNGGKAPVGKIAELISRDFGSFENFKNKFSEAAVKLFGSGWAWLAMNEEGVLEIIPLKDAYTPLTAAKKPILTLDVWEHAYYIDYRNARPKFVDSFWEIVNWDFANENLLQS